MSQQGGEVADARRKYGSGLPALGAACHGRRAVGVRTFAEFEELEVGVKARVRVLMACCIGVASVAAISVGDAIAACPMPTSNGTLTGCDSGDICMWKNDPKDASVANPKSTIPYYNQYCWYNTTFQLHDHLTIVKSRWTSGNPAIYSNYNYNINNPGYNACLAFNVEYNLKNYNWANLGGKSINDDADSHRIPPSGTYCP